MKSELDQLNSALAAVEQEETSGGPLVKQEGKCARMMKRIDRFIPTVMLGEVDKMERKACLELDKLRISNYCKCGANLGDALVPDDEVIDKALEAQKDFREQIGKVRKRGIKNPAIESYVQGGQEILGCWSAKSTAMLENASRAIDKELAAPSLTISPIDGGNPSISAIEGGNPQLSPIDGGNPSVSAIDGGSAPASGISGGNQSTPSASLPVPSAPPSSTISGGAASSTYTTSGPATNITKDVIDFSNAYNRSANSLNSIKTASPPPTVTHSAPSRPITPMQPSNSGISGRSHR